MVSSTRRTTSVTGVVGNSTSNLSRTERRELREVARATRRDILITIAEAGSGHPGGSLSETDILVTLYNRVLRHDPANPKWSDLC